MKIVQVFFFAVVIIAAWHGSGFSEGLNLDSQVKQQIEEQTIEKQFVILKSTKDYKDALQTAQIASKSLGINLDLRNLTENKKLGLSFPEKICEEENGFNFPCYVARGRYDDGDYISIEYSSAFEGFEKGYYIVVASSHPKDSNEISDILKRVKKKYKDAYARTTKVYVGCMH